MLKADHGHDETAPSQGPASPGTTPFAVPIQTTPKPDVNDIFRRFMIPCGDHRSARDAVPGSALAMDDKTIATVGIDTR
jgi:hypothetical protein